MSELEFVGVEEGSWTGGATVKFVPKEGVSQGRQLDTNLVRAARAGVDFEEGDRVGECVRESLNNAVFCFSPAPRVGGHFLGRVPGPTHHGTDTAGRFHNPHHHGKICFADRSVGKLAGNVFGGGGGFGNHHDARGSPVQAMYHTGAVRCGSLPAIGPTCGEFGPQALNQRISPVGASGVNHQAGWFIDHDQIVIFIKDGNVFRFGGGERSKGGEVDLNLVPPLKNSAGGGGLSINGDGFFFDETLNPCARERREGSCEESVQPFRFTRKNKRFFFAHAFGRV